MQAVVFITDSNTQNQREVLFFRRKGARCAKRPREMESGKACGQWMDGNSLSSEPTTTTEVGKPTSEGNRQKIERAQRTANVRRGPENISVRKIALSIKKEIVPLSGCVRM